MHPASVGFAELPGHIIGSAVRRRNMCRAIDPHDIGPAFGFQFLIAALKIFNHLVFPVSVCGIRIGLSGCIVGFALFDIFQHTLILCRIVLPIGFQIGQIPRTGAFPCMSDIRTMEHRFRIPFLDLLQKVFHDLRAALRSLPILKLQVQQLVIIRFHPKV